MDECRDTYPGWTCTTWYNNTVYGKYVCPYTASICGPGKENVNLTSPTSKDTLTITNLGRGDVCFYRVKNSCGRLKFEVENVLFNAADINGIMIEYLEFEAGSLVMANPSDVVHGRFGGAPNAEMPWRSETFVPMGSTKVG